MHELQIENDQKKEAAPVFKAKATLIITNLFIYTPINITLAFSQTAPMEIIHTAAFLDSEIQSK